MYPQPMWHCCTQRCVLSKGSVPRLAWTLRCKDGREENKPWTSLQAKQTSSGELLALDPEVRFMQIVKRRQADKWNLKQTWIHWYKSCITLDDETSDSIWTSRPSANPDKRSRATITKSLSACSNCSEFCICAMCWFNVCSTRDTHLRKTGSQ